MNNWKKKFIIIWSGQLFSILSSSIAQFSIVLWISLKTGSAEVLSFAMIAALLPQALLGAFAGVYVDRWNRKWTMIGADSFVALCSGIIALLFYLDIVELWHIYILLALRSIGGSFHSPAMKSSIPLLAPEKELTRIAGINQAIQSICNIGGPALGAVLLLAFDMSVVMLLDVAGAIIACTSLLFVYIPNPKKENISAKSVLNDMRDGFHVIMRNRGVSWVMVTEILITFFVLPIVALMPLMTLHTFSGTAYQISLIETLFGVGMLAGGALLGIWNPKIRKILMIAFSYAVLGLALAICGMLPGNGYVFFCHTDGGTRAYRAIFIRSLYRSIADAVQTDLSGTCILAFRQYKFVPFYHRSACHKLCSRLFGNRQHIYILWFCHCTDCNSDDVYSFC